MLCLVILCFFCFFVFLLFFNVFSIALLVIIDFDSASDTLLAKRDGIWNDGNIIKQTKHTSLGEHYDDGEPTRIGKYYSICCC